ncbi:hypothetical protein PR003_g7014 [Phytophthora rubi]|uniref:Protein kinase domain-containing protein n=2 Tax=Phytophthora rubi TaxID=129364 RepID=A0A6A4FF69_9STRA|nr:hypothetical protein PR003_g7014 [Phytophthora rubi]
MNRPENVIMTIDRLGDYLVALRNDFVINHPVCRRGLNLRGQLGAYESETRVLFKLAATGRVVDILLRFGRVVESYVEVMGLEKTAELIQWREQLSSERQERVHRFRQILSDEQRLLEAMGDDTQQMELLTLLKHDMTMYHGIMTPEELDVMSDVYDEVVRHSEFVLVGEPPSWFLSPHDLLCENGSYYLDAVRVSKCTTGDVFQTDSSSWEDQEEACLRQATVWADLNHPHVAKMFGACHIGNEPFIVHEPAEPLALNRSNAQSWEPLLGWALGLQYLHERELGYKSFDDNRLLARHHSTASGVLSGLGLVPIKRQTSASLQRSASNTFNMVALSDANGNVDDNRHESHMPTWSVVSDIFALGLAIYNTRQWVSMYGNEKVLVLPQECPQFLSERGWDLVGRMCARKPDRRASMWYVLHQLQAFVSASATGDDDSRDEHESYNPPNNIDDFIVRKMNVKVVKAMPRLQQKYKETPGTNGTMLEHVIDRLAGLHAQLQSRENIEEGTTVMEGFVGVLDMFYDQLTRRDLGKEQSSSSVVASFCASRAAAQKVAIFHHEIDRLLTLADLRAASAPAPTHVALADVHEGSSESIDIACDTQDAILDTRDIHDWQLKWSKARREQLRSFQACLKDTEELKRQLSDPKTRLEAQMLLQFELHKRRSSYPNSVLEVMSQALLVLDTTGGSSEVVPSWFIPPYEVVLGKHIAQGGFGDVYYGKWFDTEVVVKILKSQASATSSSKGISPPTPSSGSNDEDTMELFRREADHWFMLNHPNVVHLYGACHVGTPFFICEPAKSTSLNSHVKELARARPGYNYEEKGGDPADMMRCLVQAGIGLKYLHERGIVHCDLKGNNFMVGTDGKTIKLGDFGMSVLKRSGKGRHTSHANAGAVPWKAPEYLQGENPTVISDVYGFGMCILELISGKYPWAGITEAAVKFHVTKRKALPPRPKELNDLQWSLIQHMCCYEPSERISLDAVVDMLHTFRFE